MVILSFPNRRVRDEFAKWYGKSGTVHFFGWVNRSGKWGRKYSKHMMDVWPDKCEVMETKTNYQ